MDVLEELFVNVIRDIKKNHPEAKDAVIVCKVWKYFVDRFNNLLVKYLTDCIECPQCHNKGISPCTTCKREYFTCRNCGFTAPLDVFIFGKPSEEK